MTSLAVSLFLFHFRCSGTHGLRSLGLAIARDVGDSVYLSVPLLSWQVRKRLLQVTCCGWRLFAEVICCPMVFLCPMAFINRDPLKQHASHCSDEYQRLSVPVPRRGLLAKVRVTQPRPRVYFRMPATRPTCVVKAIAAWRIRLWLADRWGCRDRRLSRG